MNKLPVNTASSPNPVNTTSSLHPVNNERSTWWTWWHLPELAIVFAIGVGLMQFVYSATPDAEHALPVNVPGNDSFYHVKMAMLLPEIGLPGEFPWLRHTIFENQFVSHHYGFHVYLSLFVRHFDNPLVGARWAMSVSFGLVLVVAHLILMSEGIAFRWLWLTIMLALPTEFYSRHSYIRAIDLSLLFMLAGCFFMFRRRYVALALVMIVYTHVYLGSFFLGFVAVIHYISGWFGSKTRRDTWRLPLAVALGGAVGLLTHPYNVRIIGFLWTQIFGSGLTPEISVGREWKPYDDVWRFANLIGIPLSALATGVALRFRWSRPLSTNQWTMLVSSFFFLVLLFKARRFIEYFPIIATLATAMVAGPLFGRESPRPVASATVKRAGRGEFLMLGLTVLLAAGAWLNFRWGSVPARSNWLVSAAAGGALYVLVLALRRWFVHRSVESRTRWLVWAGCSFFTAVTVVGVLARVAYPLHDTVRRWGKGKFDLDDIEAAMTFLQERSEPGDVVFADDWDIFPAYFYFNHKNHYVAGLDPMFSYRHDPELWERYRLITQGRAPVTKTVIIPQTDEDGRRTMVERRISVSLEDIRDRFGARFIIVDDDHKPFACKLDRAGDLAKRIYPPHVQSAKQTAPYMIYEVLDAAAGEARDRIPDVVNP